MWERIWYFLTTPPKKLDIPFLTEGIDSLNNMTSGWISTQILQVTNWLSALLLYTPAAFLESEPFRQVHWFISLIAYGLMVPSLMWVGFRSVIGQQTAEEGLQKASRFVAVPVGVHLLPKIVLMFLNLFNHLTHLVLSTAPATPEAALNPGVFSVTMVIFLLLYVWLAIQLVRYYCYRSYAIVVLVAFSPLLLLSWAVDGGERFAKWRDEVIGLLSTQVVHALQIVILVAMTVGAGSVAEKGIPVLLLQVGALTFMTQTPSWLQGYIQSLPKSFPLGNMVPTQLQWARLLRRVKGVFKP